MPSAALHGCKAADGIRASSQADMVVRWHDDFFTAFGEDAHVCSLPTFFLFGKR